jgi:hypothetical protein
MMVSTVQLRSVVEAYDFSNSVIYDSCFKFFFELANIVLVRLAPANVDLYLQICSRFLHKTFHHSYKNYKPDSSRMMTTVAKNVVCMYKFSTLFINSKTKTGRV